MSCAQPPAPVVDDLPPAHRVDPADDVAVAVRSLGRGERVQVGGQVVELAADIPRGHKFALRALQSGQAVHKYGWPIGRATIGIAAGDHVHSHNLSTGLTGTLDYRHEPAGTDAAWSALSRDAGSFMGYRRADGRVGTRNEIWVLCTVGCVGRTAERIAALASTRFAGQVDGVVAFPHPFGCSQLGDDLAHTKAIISALAQHPNAGGVLLLGLGCESNQLDRLLRDAPGIDAGRLRAFTAQQSSDEVEDGLQAVAELVAIAAQDRRVPCPASDLAIGLKCGGSDGFSGLTANPLVGRMADRVTAAGGSAILTEIPEIFGAEELLMRRAVDETVFEGVVDVVNGFKRYFLDHDQPVYENPSPGNIAGGITTLEEKSLGAVQKGGRAPLADVIAYGGRLRHRGLTLLAAPGNDGVSATALTAAGATVILFTTGRGTPLGFPAPTLKIASNGTLARQKPNWIDFDAGSALSDTGSDHAADALWSLILATASGQATRAEKNGQREIAIWKNGVTL
ncbi:UxaA family hydrolase [Niveispirillum fermenti]|uniref:UxaA family hydrolase n=1 Tax=Niveispirillum fermenti TaxID=1233113 RepID=UPI003A8481A4